MQVISNAHSVIVGEVEYPKNTLQIRTNANAATIQIETLSGKPIVFAIPFAEYVDGSNVPYSDFLTAVGAIRSAIFA